MEHIAPHILIVLEIVIFSGAVLMHIARKNTTAISLYALQSVGITALLAAASIETPSFLLVLALLATLTVKVIVAPLFFFRLVRRHQLTFTSSTYLSGPLTLIAIAGLLALTQTRYFAPLAALGISGQHAVILGVAMALISLFLTINRKGALSQILGILSFENGIVTFALGAGLEQNPGLQLGITFDILLWVVIASIFISMMYRQFGTLDVTKMRTLTE